MEPRPINDLLLGLRGEIQVQDAMASLYTPRKATREKDVVIDLSVFAEAALFVHANT